MLLALGVTLTNCTSETDFSNSENEKTSKVGQNANYEANEVLVKFKEGTSESKKSEILSLIGGKVNEIILTKMM